LWTTAPLLPDGLAVMNAWGFSYVMNAWGFSYKSNIVRDKEIMAWATTRGFSMSICYSAFEGSRRFPSITQSRA
jgi:hypothetical protein